MYRKLKALNPDKLVELLNALRRGERLCESLDHNLQKKAHLTDKVNTLLDIRTVENKPGTLDREDLRRRVLGLWKENKEIPDIADAVGVTQGEVEFMISLAKTLNQAGERKQETG